MKNIIIVSFILLIPMYGIAQSDSSHVEVEVKEEREDNTEIKEETEAIVEVEVENKKKKNYGTDHFLSIDIGINNYHNEGNFPDEDNELYSVRPWGSWYVALTALQRTHVHGGLFLEWGGGVSWYNFKFQEDNLIISEGPEEVFFETGTDPFDYQKSKLTISHVNLYLVPVYQFGKNKYTKSSNKWEHWSNYDDRGFRIGLGGYAGYRIDSYSKLKYQEEGSDDDEKVRDHDNFYLENLRYGVRLQLGYKGSDIFINYDINSLFAEGRGPELSAVSFGLIL